MKLLTLSQLLILALSLFFNDAISSNLTFDGQLKPKPVKRKELAGPSGIWLNAVQDGVDAVDGSQWTKDIQKIGSYNRYYKTVNGDGLGLEAAQEYVIAELRAALEPAGERMIDVVRKDAIRGHTTPASYNIEGGIQGSVLQDRMIVIGAHLDSTSESPSKAAPGVEDNASGCAALLHMARIFGRLCTEKTSHTSSDLCLVTFRFVFFTGEEAGRYGSEKFVENYGEDAMRKDLVAAHIMDMVAYLADPDGDGGDPQFYMETYTRHLDRYRDVYFPAIEKYAPHMGRKFTREPDESDHMSFLDMGGHNKGVSAVLVTSYDSIVNVGADNEGYPHYHRTTDTFDKVNEGVALDIIRVSIGAISMLSYKDAKARCKDEEVRKDVGGGATELVEWKDFHGDSCYDYESRNLCSPFGYQEYLSMDGFMAREACCVCGGGTQIVVNAGVHFRPDQQVYLAVIAYVGLALLSV